jgi:hypothetical protein
MVLRDKAEIKEAIQQFKQADHYEAIGEFIFRFSQLEFTIRARLFHALGLKQELFDIITGPYDFAMLCTVAAETLKCMPTVTAAKQKTIDKYFNDCKGFNAANRVVVAHGMWTTSGARHVSRNSLKAKTHFPEVKELKEKCNELRILMIRIGETKI